MQVEVIGVTPEQKFEELNVLCPFFFSLCINRQSPRECMLCPLGAWKEGPVAQSSQQPSTNMQLGREFSLCFVKFLRFSFLVFLTSLQWSEIQKNFSIYSLNSNMKQSDKGMSWAFEQDIFLCSHTWMSLIRFAKLLNWNK